MANDVLERLRCATHAELEAIAGHLQVDLEADSDVNLVRLTDAYQSDSHDDYRAALLSVASHVAAEAKWKKLPDVDDRAEVAWIEEYIHQGFVFIHREDLKSLSDAERARCRESANEALCGNIKTAKEQSDNQLSVITAAVGVGIGLLFWELMLAGAAVVAAATFFKSLFGGSPMKRLAPATFVLIHIRKRLEYEDVLRLSDAEAA